MPDKKLRLSMVAFKAMFKKLPIGVKAKLGWLERRGERMHVTFEM